jgi:hypothetical protein
MKSCLKTINNIPSGANQVNIKIKSFAYDPVTENCSWKASSRKGIYHENRIRRDI